MTASPYPWAWNGKPSLPLNAEEICLEWPIEEGGFGVTARTDPTGQPIIGIYGLDPERKVPGPESRYGYDHLMIRVVAGVDEQDRAIIVFADIHVTADGLALRVLVPSYLISHGYDRYLFAPWAKPSAPARRRFD